jgi:glycosyltransferase involved in cell wall biosynthesis
MRLRVNWICELPTHYNDVLFNEMVKNQNIDFTVYYMLKKLDTHPWKSSIRKYNFNFYKRLVFVDWRLLIKGLTEPKTIWIIGSWFDITSLLIIFIRSLFGWNYIIWTDTPDTRKRRKNFYNYFRSIVVKYILSKASFVLGTGQQSLSILHKLGSVPQRTINMPYFVDVTLFKPLDSSTFFNKSKLVFISAGRLLNDIKGYDLALLALANFKIKYPHVDFMYKIAGVGIDIEILKELTLKLNLNENVEFVGWLEADQLPGFFSNGHYFLHPAHYEPFGVSVIEAMAAGLIVIGSDVTGAILDRVAQDKSGFIHIAGSKQSLLEQIEKIMQLSNNEILNIRNNSIEMSNKWNIGAGIKIINNIIEITCAE